MTRAASIFAWISGLGFGTPGAIGLIYFAQHRTVWTFLGFPTYGGGPLEDWSLPTSIPSGKSFYVSRSNGAATSVMNEVTPTSFQAIISSVMRSLTPRHLRLFGPKALEDAPPVDPRGHKLWEGSHPDIRHELRSNADRKHRRRLTSRVASFEHVGVRVFD